MNIFELMFPPIKFKGKIRLFEAFSGIGTQAMALKRLGVDLEIVGISEIDKYAIQSYEAIHGKVKNYGGIGSFDKLPAGVDVATWSFPCQDISLAGRQKGLGGGTRSNYGFQFLDTVERTPPNERPKVLLMENVKALLSEKFRDDWRDIQFRLEQMGYKNYAESLMATDYGIPQTRDRVFVVSVLGDYSYTFPKRIPLEKRLKDYLEDEVDESYYLSQKQISDIQKWSADDLGVVVKTKSENTLIYKTKEEDMPRHRIYDIENSRDSFTITTNESQMPKLLESLRIRKLTPLEAWRLMGISDDDFYKAQKVVSNSQLYKQAGNAIVVDVLVAIFREMIDYE